MRDWSNDHPYNILRLINVILLFFHRIQIIMENNNASIASLIQKTYQCISGNNHTERDWQTYRTLFIPDARLTIVLKGNNTNQLLVYTIDDYIQNISQLLGDSSFFERDVQHRIEYQDSFAVVWSDYEARIVPQGEIIYTGTNCFQLYFDGNQWRIISLLWERKAKPEFFENPHS